MLPTSSMSHTSIFLISSSNTSNSPLDISYSPTMWVLLYFVAPHGHIFIATSSSSRLLVYLFLLSGRSKSPTRNRSFSYFVKSIAPCRYVFIPISSLNPPYISKCFSSFTFFPSASLYLSSIIYFCSVLYPPNFSIGQYLSLVSP